MFKGIVVVLCFIRGTVCFNFDTDFPIVYEDSAKNERNYFGYSVALFAGNNTEWLRIGSPRGKNKNSIRTGVVYHCPLDRYCTKMNLIENKVMKAKQCNTTSYTRNFDVLKRFKNSWLGAAMDVNSNSMAICAPLFVNEGSKIDYVTGSCFWFDVESNSSFPTYPNLYENSKTNELIVVKDSIYYGFAQAGFSVHLPEDGNELVVGAPGVYKWIGTPLKLEKCGAVLPYVYDTTGSLLNKLFGYSVTSGYFQGNKGGRLYAASRPKAAFYKGEVVFFRFKRSNQTIAKKWIWRGEQIGEYFGAALTTGDINNDSYDDLIVGAPFYKDHTYNEGRIYVFKGGKDAMSKVTVINGYQAKSQFGTSVMFLGDINSDGYGDVAVGAPYENDLSGVVYIYRGIENGLDTNCFQKILGKSIIPKIRGFGISFSRPADIDGNGCKDIAIGSHLSGHATVLRSKPVVIIENSLQITPNPIIRDRGNFTIEECFTFMSLPEVHFIFETEIRVDPVLQRTSFPETRRIRNMTFKGLIRSDCKTHLVQLKETITDFKKPLVVESSYTLLGKEVHPSIVNMSAKSRVDGFCKNCPVLDERSSKTPNSVKVPFISDCGDDMICKADLCIVSVDLVDYSNNSFMVGSSDYLLLKIEIENRGENAYSAELEVKTGIIKLTEDNPCKDHTCPIKDPLKSNEKETIFLKFDASHLNDNYFSEELVFHVRTLTTSNVTSDYGTESFNLKLERQAELRINGVPEGHICGEADVVQYSQLFQVEKFGISSIKEAKVIIQIPYGLSAIGHQKTFLRITRDPILTYNSAGCNITYPPLKNIDAIKNSHKRNRTVLLNCGMDSVTCVIIECTIGPITGKYLSGFIEVEHFFDASNISELFSSVQKINMSIRGEINIEIPKNVKQSGNYSSFEEVNITITRLIKLKIQLWVVIVSAAMGVLLLVLLIIALVKIGFFKRSKKKELEDLKTQAEVHDSIPEESEIEIRESPEPLEPPGFESNLDLIDNEST